MKIVRNRAGKSTAWAVIVTLLLPLFAAVGCGGGSAGSQANAAPIDDSGFGYNRQGNAPMGAPLAPTGMTTRQKLVALTGAAALYYLYKTHNSQAGVTPANQYYLSKNGRVYYRDAQSQVHWVTPPTAGIQVPEQEARDYRGFQGYEASSTGRDLTNLPEARM